MHVRAILLAGAMITFVQPATSRAQGEAAPVGQQDAAVTAVPAATTEEVPAAGAAPAEAPAAAAVAAATSLPDAAEAEPAAEDDPMVCRKQLETGTLGRWQKICMTKSQWERHRQATRKFLKSVNQSRATQPGGEALGPSSGSPGG